MKDRNKAVPASYLFLIKDKKILVMRRCNTGYEDGKYQVPAGHVEADEMPVNALMREAKEEIGIDIDRSDVEFVHVSYRPKHDETGERVDFFFKVTKWKGEVVIAEPNKCDELKWVAFNDLPKNMTLHVRKAIEAMNKGIFFEEIGIDELKQAGLYKL